MNEWMKIIHVNDHMKISYVVPAKLLMRARSFMGEKLCPIAWKEHWMMDACCRRGKGQPS